MSAATDWAGYQDAVRFSGVLLDGGDGVVELRAPDARLNYGKGTVSGYFDDADKLAQAAAGLDGDAPGIYVTLNPVLPDLLARANHRLKERPRSTTSDDEIVRRRFILIDVDPTRPTGISATKQEREAAFSVLREVGQCLAERGFPAPIKLDSGNGGHLIYAVDLPREDGGLVERFLRALAFRFDSAAARVDQAVHNPARITKLPGTLAMKGDSTPERPHRRSRLIGMPEKLVVVHRGRLESVAAELPQERHGHPARARTDTTPLDVDAFLARHGIEVIRQGPWKDGQRWVLRTCPFNSDHSDGAAYIVQRANGALAAGCHHNGCSGLGWSDLRDRLEPDRHNRQNRQKGASVSCVSTVSGVFEVWPELEPLPDGLPPVLEFDPELLPGRLRHWVKDIAERIQCPLIFVAVSAMVGLAGVLGRRVAIRPKLRDSWTVVPNLWGALIGRPGVMKTPAVTEALRPLKRLEVAAKKSFDEAMVLYGTSDLVQKQRQKDVERRILDAIKKGEDDPHELAQKALLNAEAPPVRHRYLVNDATVEKLGEILAENPNGVTTFRDELVGLLRQLDKPGQEQARAFYLEAWNGDNRFTYDRIGRGTVDIESVTLSVIGSIQPGPLSQYLSGTAIGGAGDDGLLQRFQLAVWPDIDQEWVNVDRWPDTAAKNEAFEVFDALDALDPLAVGANRDDFENDDEIPYLRLSSAAQDRFDEWRAALERRLRSGEEHSAMESHLAKYRSLVPSLSLLIHLADGNTENVSDDALERGIGWGLVLESHARRIYDAVVDVQGAAARELGKRILTRQLEEGFGPRTVYRKGWTGLREKGEVEAGLALLAELGWLRAETQSTRGRSKTIYLINPRVYGLAHDHPGPTDRTDRRSGETRSINEAPPVLTDRTDESPAGLDASVSQEPRCHTDGTDRSSAGDPAGDRLDSKSSGPPPGPTDRTARSPAEGLPSVSSVRPVHDRHESSSDEGLEAAAGGTDTSSGPPDDEVDDDWEVI